MNYYLAIDIGASSGRHILGYVQDGRLCLEEIYRFENGYIEKDGHFFWDTDKLFDSICAGIKRCKEIGKLPVSLSIDTWGVDYALLDKNDRLIDGIIAYRDPRSENVPEELYSIMPKRELFERTGIAENTFNTIFQLYDDKKSGRLDAAESLLFVPCYLNYLLTGKKLNEYTFASTTGLLNVNSRDWDLEVCEKLDYPTRLFSKLGQPGDFVGMLDENIAGFTCKVCLCASHDTASAVAAVPAKNSPLFISSGTWSLIGIESDRPYTDEYSEMQKFTNEGGVCGTVRFLQNIMGLWMIQSIKRELNNKYSYPELMELAQSSNYNGIAKVNDPRFLAPDNMCNAICDQLVENAYAKPESIGDLLRSVYFGLAHAYAEAADGIEKITGRKFDTVHIVGGGSRDEYLNELTARIAKRKVITGITEATAIGNLAVQLIASGEVKDISDARCLIAKSFELKEKT